MTIDKFSFEYIHWGGSPKRILGKSPVLSEEFVKTVVELDEYVRSSDTTFERILKEGGLSWVLLPIQNSRANVLITSALVQQQGVRPIWHFLALIIKKNDFSKFDSVKQLLASILDELSYKWWERDFVIKETFDFAVSEDSEKLKSIDANNEKVLDALCAQDVSYLIDHAIAWNPSVKEKDWEYVISTDGWIAYCRYQQEQPGETKKEASTEQQFSKCPENAKNPTDSQNENKTKKGRPEINGKQLPSLKILTLFLILFCVLAVVAFTLSPATKKQETVAEVPADKGFVDKMVDELSNMLIGGIAQYSPEALKSAILDRTEQIKNAYNAEYVTVFDDSWKFPFMDLLIPGCARRFTVSIQVSAEMVTDLRTMEISRGEKLIISIPKSVIRTAKVNRSSLSIRGMDVGVFRSPELASDEVSRLVNQPITPSGCRVGGSSLQQAADAFAVKRLSKLVRRLGVRSLEINVR